MRYILYVSTLRVSVPTAFAPLLLGACLLEFDPALLERDAAAIDSRRDADADASRDGGVDASEDASVDAGTDGGGDAARDGGADGGLILGCLGTRPGFFDTGLLGYWSFNRSEAPERDDSDNDLRAVVEGAPTSVAGVVGAALEFDGTDDAIEVLDDVALDLFVGDFTVEAAVMIALPSAAAGTLVGRGADPPSATWSLAHDGDDRVVFHLRDSAGAEGSLAGQPGEISDGRWHDLVVTRSGGSLSLRVDTALAATLSDGPAGSLDGDHGITIGRDHLGTHTAAQLDEVRLWSRALTAEELAQQRTLLRAPGLVGYWPLDGSAAAFGGLGVDGAAQEITFPAGRAGRAAGFEGRGGAIAFELESLDFGQDYTMMGWFRTRPALTPSGQQSIFNREAEGDARAPLHVWLDNEQLAAVSRDNSSLRTGVSVRIPADLVDGCWHHVAVVRQQVGDTTWLRLHADGEVAEASAVLTPNGVTDSPLYLGMRTFEDPRHFQGAIDEVRLFDRALSPEEVEAAWTALR